MITFFIIWYGLFLACLALCIANGAFTIKELAQTMFFSFPLVALLLLIATPFYLIDKHGDSIIWRKK